MSKYDKEYVSYFDTLDRELREHHGFPKRIDLDAENSNRAYYPSKAELEGIRYEARFVVKGGLKIRAGIYIEKQSKVETNGFFNTLVQRKKDIESRFGSPLEWESACNTLRARISVCRDCSKRINEFSGQELADIRDWHVKMLVKLREIFEQEIQTDKGDFRCQKTKPFDPSTAKV